MKKEKRKEKEMRGTLHFHILINKMNRQTHRLGLDSTGNAHCVFSMGPVHCSRDPQVRISAIINSGGGTLQLIL